MTNVDIWVSLLCNGNPCYHRQLLQFLDGVPFELVVEKDTNRIADAIAFRHKYVDRDAVRDASVLEVLAALSFRIEDNVLWESDDTVDRSRLFWIMLDNIGLMIFDDDNFDASLALAYVQRWMYHCYCPDGFGGAAFIVPDKDIVLAELWYQAHWYIDYKSNQNEPLIGSPLYERRRNGC